MDELLARYSSAIVSIAKEEGKLNEYKIAIFDLANKFSSENNLLKYLKSYFVSNEEKNKFIDELCSSYNINNLTNFIKLLAKKHQIYRFNDIAKQINKDINEELEIFEGFVYSTSLLEKEKIEEIENAISKKLQRKVELTNRVDERLIGGVKVVVHDHVFDGSILHKLESMKQNILERRTTNEN